MSTCKRMWTDREVRSMADESAKIRIEAGLTSNAKPIYCHPIVLLHESGGRVFRLTCMLFNNDPTPFTLDTLKKWLDDKVEETSGRVRIMASGASSQTKGAGEETPSNKVIIVSSIEKTDTNNYTVQGIAVTDGSTGAYTDPTWTNVFPADTTIVDGVNKIN